MKKKKEIRKKECPKLKVCGVPIIRGYRGEEFFIDKFCQKKNGGWQKCPHFQDRLKERQKTSSLFGRECLKVACR